MTDRICQCQAFFPFFPFSLLYYVFSFLIFTKKGTTEYSLIIMGTSSLFNHALLPRSCPSKRISRMKDEGELNMNFRLPSTYYYFRYMCCLLWIWTDYIMEFLVFDFLLICFKFLTL